MYQPGRWSSREHATICFPAFRDNVAGVVAPISKYNVILGKPWLYKHNPKIDFWKNDVEFNDADQNTGAAEPAARGVAPTGETKEELTAQQARVDEELDPLFITAKAARKAIRKVLTGTCYVSRTSAQRRVRQKLIC